MAWVAGESGAADPALDADGVSRIHGEVVAGRVPLARGWKKEGDRWVETGWAKTGAVKFLRLDCARVGIVIGRKGREANGGRVLDFHSFRHTFISNISRLGLSDGMRRVLSRATAEVTERYTHREASELVEVVDRLPVADLSGLQLPVGEKA